VDDHDFQTSADTARGQLFGAFRVFQLVAVILTTNLVLIRLAWRSTNGLVYASLACSFLLLVLDTIDIVLRDVLVSLRQPVVHIIADISLYCNLLAPASSFRNTASCRELLTQLLGNLLQIQAMLFQP
jgi:hypothetical protein